MASVSRLTVRDLISPRGAKVKLAVRDGTSDLSIALSTFAEPGQPHYDEYRLARWHVAGRALDVGAHIGVVTVALLADNPDLTVVAIEPLAANVRMIRNNLALNGFRQRCLVLHGAIGASEVEYDYAGDEGDFRRVNRFVGHLQELVPTAKRKSRVATIDPRALGQFDFAKWDCEGCEWSALTNEPRIVVGEWHGDPGIARLHAIFDATHDLEVRDDGAAGNFWAVRR